MNATDYGFSGSASPSQNGGALSAAAALAGEGHTVTIPPGAYTLIGATIPRGVTLDIAAGAVVTSGDITSSTPTISNKTYTNTGTITAGSATLTLGSASPALYVGDIVAISGAGGTFDGTAMAHMSQVVSIVGTTVTLSEPAVTSATSATVTHGASNVVITGGGVIDGNYTVGDTLLVRSPIMFQFANNCTSDVAVRNAPWIGVYVTSGSRNCDVSGSFTSIGNQGNGGNLIGSAVWFFGGVRNSRAHDIITTNCTYAVIIDDRSSSQSQYDGTSDYNTVEDVTATGGAGGGVVIEGCSYNTVRHIDVDGGAFGLAVVQSLQGSTQFRGAINNSVTASTARNCTIGLKLNGTNTTQSGITYVGCTTNLQNLE